MRTDEHGAPMGPRNGGKTGAPVDAPGRHRGRRTDRVALPLRRVGSHDWHHHTPPPGRRPGPGPTGQRVRVRETATPAKVGRTSSRGTTASTRITAVDEATPDRCSCSADHGAPRHRCRVDTAPPMCRCVRSDCREHKRCSGRPSTSQWRYRVGVPVIERCLMCRATPLALMESRPPDHQIGCRRWRRSSPGPVCTGR